MTAGTQLSTFSPELRNHIINGNFDCWQRGSSISVSNSVANYLADRFQWYSGGSAPTATVSASTDVPTQAQSGFQSRYSFLVTTTNQVASPTSNAQVGFTYKMEGQDYQVFHARKARLQFWVKSSVPGTYPVTFMSSDKTRVYVTTYSIASAGVWQYVAQDVTLDNTTGSPWNFDNTTGLMIFFGLMIGSGEGTSSLNTWQTVTAGAVLGSTAATNLWSGTSGATFQIAQVALYPVTAGSGTVLPFSRAGRTVGHELQLCQRYYVNGNFFSANFGAAASQYVNIPFPVPLRGSPNSCYVSNTVTAPGVITANANCSGVVAGYLSVQAYNNTAGACGYAYTVDAEL